MGKGWSYVCSERNEDFCLKFVLDYIGISAICIEANMSASL